jgi:hypothetical protein
MLRVVIFGDPHFGWPAVVVEWLSRLPRCVLVLAADMPVQRMMKATAEDFGYELDTQYLKSSNGSKYAMLNRNTAAIASADAAIAFTDGVCKPTKVSIVEARKTLPTWVIYSPPSARVIGDKYRKVNL